MTHTAARPPAAKKGPRHSIFGLRRTRHSASKSQLTVAAIAMAVATSGTEASSPGTSRATDAAIFGGTPAFHAPKYIHMARSANVNSTSENQSIALSAARRSVDTLKAPSTTRPGTAAISSRSLASATIINAMTDDAVISKGSSTCGRRQKLRHEYRVHRANGHSGHVYQPTLRTNHIRLAKLGP